MKRPMSYYVAASKRSREKRHQLAIHLSERNTTLEREITGLSSRAHSLNDELNTLIQDSKSRFKVRRRNEIINESLKLQIVEHRLLFAKLRSQFMEMDETLVRMAVLDAVKQNISFVFHEIESLMNQTRFIHDSLPLRNGPTRLKKKKQLYREMLNVICRYISLTSNIIPNQFDEEAVLNWAPDLDFYLLTIKKVDVYVEGQERTRRIDIYDIPISPLLLQKVFKKIDFASILVMSYEALQKNLEENGALLARPKNMIAFRDPWHLPLRILSQNDNVVSNFSVALTRPASLASENFAVLSASSMSGDCLSPSYIIQCPLKDPKFVVQSEAEKGSLYLKGFRFKQGEDENHTDFSFLIRCKLSLSNKSENCVRIAELGGKEFLQEHEPSLTEVQNLLEAIIKCSSFVFLSLLTNDVN